MKLTPALAGMAFAVQAGSVLAQSTSGVPENAVLVTATRTARTADQTLASVTVITRVDIERSQANDVPELLRGLPGVMMTSTGGYGKGASLFLRGTNPGHVLVLVDGIKVGSATSGAPTWEFLPLAEIERIEIVRGPRSSLYGSEAIGGVVQIFTRRGSGPTSPDAKVTVGSLHTHDVGAGVSGGPGNAWFNVHAGHFRTRGINATLPRSSAFEPDSDGMDSLYGSFRVGYRLPRETEIELHGWQARGDTEFDSPGFLNETNFRQSSGGVRAQSRVTSIWNMSLHAGESKDNTYNFRADGTVTPSRFNTKRRTLSWQNDLALGDHQLLTVGHDNQEDFVTSTENLAKTSRDNEAWFTLYQGELGLHSFQASLRRDDNEQFGRHGTGSVAYGYALTPQYRWFTSYGTGFRAPNFVDLYWPDPFFSTGNPNLQPEESKSFEAGVGGKPSAATQWAASLFRTRIENLIVLTGSNFLPTNLNRATINGLELTGSTHVEAWELGANLTLLDPRDDATGRYLQRRSRYATRLDLDRRIAKTQVGATLLTQGARYDDVANQVRLGGYTLLNLRVEQTFSRSWRAGVRLENVTDKEYQTVAGFNNFGRALFATLYYQPAAR